MAIKKLYEKGIVKFVVTSNHDNLLTKSGVPSNAIAELFGNAYIERCLKCDTLYTRKTVTPSLGRTCDNSFCGGRLVKTGVRFGQATPIEPLKKGSEESKKADLALVIGSSMTVSPFCNLPPMANKMVICNLQDTPYDSQAKIKFSMKCDELMRYLLKELEIKVDPFTYIQEFVIGHRMENGKPILYLDGSRNNEPCNCVSMVQVKISNQTIEMNVSKYTFLLPLDTEEQTFPITVHFKPEFDSPPLEVKYHLTPNPSSTIYALTKTINYD